MRAWAWLCRIRDHGAYSLLEASQPPRPPLLLEFMPSLVLANIRTFNSHSKQEARCHRFFTSLLSQANRRHPWLQPPLSAKAGRGHFVVRPIRRTRNHHEGSPAAPFRPAKVNSWHGLPSACTRAPDPFSRDNISLQQMAALSRGKRHGPLTIHCLPGDTACREGGGSTLFRAGTSRHLPGAPAGGSPSRRVSPLAMLGKCLCHKLPPSAEKPVCATSPLLEV